MKRHGRYPKANDEGRKSFPIRSLDKLLDKHEKAGEYEWAPSDIGERLTLRLRQRTF